MAPRFKYIGVLAIVLACALGLRLWDPGPVAQLRFLVFDAYQRLSPRIYDPNVPVRIIDIDEASLKKVGQWPWPRTVLADLVTKLQAKGAAAIAFDLIFTEEDRLSPELILERLPTSERFEALRQEIGQLPSHDAQFAKAIERAPVILGFVAVNKSSSGGPMEKAGIAFAGDDPKAFVPSFVGAAASLKILQEKAKGTGALNWIPEYDQIIRRIPLFLRVGETLYPSLAGESLRLAQGASSYLIKSSGASGEEAFGQKTGINTVRIGNVVIPTDANGQFWLKFTHSDERRYLPAWKLLEDKIAAEDVQGRIILIGTSAAGLFDLRTTPLEASVPGVEVHAQAIEQMFLQNFLLRPDFALAAELLYLLLAGVLLAFLIYRLGAIRGALLGVLAISAVFALSWFSYSKLHWLVDPVYPAISLAVIHVAGTLMMYLRTESERNRVRSAFSLYMAPTLVEELAKHPEKLKLGGEMRDLTLLFCDVRGFTTLSEGMDAQVLTRFINSLFTPLSEIILDERGTIDKYMGDAIMAFWNAPLDDADHARHGCRAALKMIDCVDMLNRRWRSRVENTGQTYTPLRLGVGLNSGPCCVGNLGSEMRFDYSAIGDNVNVASRLEEQTKDYGVNIIAGESTRLDVPDFAWLEVDRIAVKGRSEAVGAFTLLGDETVAKSQSFLALKGYHDHMLDAIRARNWERAEEFAACCTELGGNQLQRLYELYALRIVTERNAPPAMREDGINNA